MMIIGECMNLSLGEWGRGGFTVKVEQGGGGWALVGSWKIFFF